MSNILVAFFSATGNTSRAANTLADVTGADLYEIRPKEPYTQADLNWTDKSSRSTVESNDPDAMPLLADQEAPVEGHDIILLGFPIWWHGAPPVIRTFLEDYDFNGKKIYLFATSGGSDLSRALPKIQEMVPGADVKAGLIANWPHNSPASLEKWAKKEGIIQ